MLRRPLTVLSALSLLLCGATAVLWVRSWRVATAFGWDGGAAAGGTYRDYYVVSREGHLSCIALRVTGSDGRRSRFFLDEFKSTPGEEGESDVQLAGFGYKHEENADSQYQRVILPHWALMTALAAAPLLVLWRSLRRRRRRSLGLCVICGYDLRATPGRCPECGESAAVGGAKA
jgi:hypothetical protein